MIRSAYADHITSNFLKAVFHKFYFVHLEYLDPIIVHIKTSTTIITVFLPISFGLQISAALFIHILKYVPLCNKRLPLINAAPQKAALVRNLIIT